MIDGVKFSLVDRLGALSGGGGSSGGELYNSGEAGSGEYEGGYEVSNAEGVRLMVMDAPPTTWAGDEEDSGAWAEGGSGSDGDGDVVDVEAMPLDE